MSESSPSLADIATMLDAKVDKALTQVDAKIGDAMSRVDKAMAQMREEMNRRDANLREERARDKEEAARHETRTLVRFGGIVVGAVALLGVFLTALNLRDMPPAAPVSPVTVQFPPTLQYAPPPAANGNGAVQR